MNRCTDPNPSQPGLAPVRFRQTPSQREAVRVANGANPVMEWAKAVAMLVACVLSTLTLFAIQVRGCW
jgi:predicted metallo-beta-lactamase superfamily hydrolase